MSIIYYYYYKLILTIIYYILLITNGFQLRTPSSSCVSTWRSCAPTRAGALPRWRASSSRPKAAIYLGIFMGISWISWGFYWDLTGSYGIWMGFDLGLQKRFYFWFFSWGFYWDFMGDSWDLGFPPHQGYLNGANNDKPRGFAVPYVQTKPYIVGVETKEILVVSRVVTRICYSMEIGYCSGHACPFVGDYYHQRYLSIQ